MRLFDGVFGRSVLEKAPEPESEGTPLDADARRPWNPQPATLPPDDDMSGWGTGRFGVYSHPAHLLMELRRNSAIYEARQQRLEARRAERRLARRIARNVKR